MSCHSRYAYSILVLASKNAKNLFGVAWWILARHHLWRFTKARVRSARAPPYLDAFESTRKKIRTTVSGLEELPWIHERECRSVKDRLLRRQGTSWVSCPSLLFTGKTFALTSVNTVFSDSFIQAMLTLDKGVISNFTSRGTQLKVSATEAFPVCFFSRQSRTT